MTGKPETFKFIREVPCADFDGKPIREGSVLQEIEGKDRGVVTGIGREGSPTWKLPPLSAVGDIAIQTGPGIHRVTNRYSAWLHIPRDSQTHAERFLSWCQIPFDYDDSGDGGDGEYSRSEALAIDGILALLPDEQRELFWEGPFGIPEALYFLANHIDLISSK